MRIRFLYILLILPFILNGQNGDYPYDQWIKDLSVRKDVMNEKFQNVYTQITKADTNDICQIINELLKRDPNGQSRLTIRLKMLEERLYYNQVIKRRCTSDSIPDMLLNVLGPAYELEDDRLLFQLYCLLAADYNAAVKNGEALLYGLLATELFNKYGPNELFPMAYTQYNLALSQYKTRDYRNSVNTAINLLHPQRGYLLKHDTIDDGTKMRAWNTLGLSYFKLNNHDSALIAFDHALEFAKKEDSFWTALIDGNKGDVYFQQGKLDSAKTRLQKDCEASLEMVEFDNAANSLQWLAQIDLANNQPLEALNKTREAERLLQRKKNDEYLARVMQTYTDIFINLGQKDSIKYYLNKFLVLHDANEQIASDRRAENILIRLRSTEDILTIKALNKDKRRVALIRNFILIVILLTALVGFVILNRQKIALRLRRQEALEAKREAEKEAQQAKEKLSIYTRNLLEKNQLVETLQEKLLVREMSEEQKMYINELSRHSILTDEDWDDFKLLFEKVYPGFFHSLRQKISDLTPAEQRMAAICKLQLSNKEAASLLGIAPNSVIKAKQRLRHRLELEPESDLDSYFANSKDF